MLVDAVKVPELVEAGSLASGLACSVVEVSVVEESLVVASVGSVASAVESVVGSAAASELVDGEAAATVSALVVRARFVLVG